jgi:hypothetical protein
MPERLRCFAPATIAAELARPDTDRVIEAADQGWAALGRRAPELAALAGRIHAQPGPLVAALAQTPSTFLHGDWKMGNLGSHPDGRTILLDWPTRARGRPAGTWPGTSRSTGHACRSPRRRPSRPSAARCGRTASTPPAGSTSRPPSACSP